MSINKEDFSQGNMDKMKKRLRETLKEQTLEIWRKKWEETSKNKWIFKLLKDPGKWTNTKIGQCNFYTTQLLTGQGVFGEFRKRIGKSRLANCWFCDSTLHNAEHTLLHCKVWEEARKILFTELNLQNSSSTEETQKHMAEKLRENKENWEAFSTYATTVMTSKEEEERRREREEVEEGYNLGDWEREQETNRDQEL